MAKKIALFLIIIIVLSFGMTYADEQVTKYSYSLSLEEAVKLGIENNKSIKIAQLDIEKNQVVYKKASSQWSRAAESSIVETKLLSDGYYKKQADMAVKLSKTNKELLKKKVELEIKNNYYEIGRSMKDIEVKEKNIERVIKQLNIAEAKLKVGSGIKREVLTAEAAVEEAKLSLENAKDDLFCKEMEFNKVLGIPLNTKINLTDNVIDGIEAPETAEINLTEKVKLALENRIEVIQAQENIEVTKLYFDIVSKYAAKNTYDFREANYEKEKAVNRLEESKQSVEISVNNAFLNMKKAVRAMNVYEKNIISLEEAYRLSQISYEAGVGVQIDVLNAQSMLFNAELAYIQSRHSYNLAKLSFEASYGIGY